MAHSWYLQNDGSLMAVYGMDKTYRIKEDFHNDAGACYILAFEYSDPEKSFSTFHGFPSCDHTIFKVLKWAEDEISFIESRNRAG